MTEMATLINQFVSVEGYKGVAWYVDDPETVPDEDTEWTGIWLETGRLECHMVGDDRTFVFDPEELTLLPDDEFCPGCGQIGCKAYQIEG